MAQLVGILVALAAAAVFVVVLSRQSHPEETTESRPPPPPTVPTPPPPPPAPPPHSPEGRWRRALEQARTAELSGQTADALAALDEAEDAEAPRELVEAPRARIRALVAEQKEWARVSAKVDALVTVGSLLAFDEAKKELERAERIADRLGREPERRAAIERVDGARRDALDHVSKTLADASEALDANDLDGAAELLVKARAIAPDSTVLLALQGRLERARLEARERPKPVPPVRARDFSEDLDRIATTLKEMQGAFQEAKKLHEANRRNGVDDSADWSQELSALAYRATELRGFLVQTLAAAADVGRAIDDRGLKRDLDQIYSDLQRAAAAASATRDEGAVSAAEKKEIAKREKLVDQAESLGARWFHISSDRYEVYSQIDARFTAELSFFMDTFRKKFSSIFEGPSLAQMRPELYIYADQASYQARLKALGAGDVSNSGGIYVPRWNQAGRFTSHTFYSFMQGADAASRTFAAYPKAVLLHEGTHQIVQELCGPVVVPAWFTEGLATYFQLWDIRSSTEENLKRRSRRLTNAKAFWNSYHGNHFPNIYELLTVDQAGGWAPDNFGPITIGHYEAVESLFIFLLSTKDGQTRVNALFQHVQAKHDLSKVLDKGTREQWEHRWHEYIEKVLKDPKGTPQPGANDGPLDFVAFNKGWREIGSKGDMTEEQIEKARQDYIKKYDGKPTRYVVELVEATDAPDAQVRGGQRVETPRLRIDVKSDYFAKTGPFYVLIPAEIERVRQAKKGSTIWIEGHIDRKHVEDLGVHEPNGMMTLEHYVVGVR